MGGGKVLADDRDQLDGGEPRSGKAEIAGATAEDITGAFGRGVHRVQGDRAHHEDRLYLVAHQSCKCETTWYSARCSEPFSNFSLKRMPSFGKFGTSRIFSASARTTAPSSGTRVV